jgi:hypothetical protein
MHVRKLSLSLMVLTGLLLMGATSLWAAPAMTPAQQDDHVLTTAVLANATYLMEDSAEGQITLVNGEYEEEIVPGSASKLRVNLIDEGIAYGDLNGDGVEDAAVLLASNSGGSGVFIYLASVLDEDGQPVNTASTVLGDRVQINSMTIEDGVITVEMVTQGPDDPMCCPTQETIAKYTLEGDQLIEQERIDNADQDAHPFDDLFGVLGNMTYQSEFGEDGTVTLENGHYETPAAPGSASLIQVTATGYADTGDLNGDGAEDAAIVLASSGGGTGVFMSLAAVIDDNGQPVNVANADLGDRSQINDLYIEEGQIVVDLVVAGPDDAACCPTQHVIQRYALEGDALTLVDEEVMAGEETEEAAAEFAPDADPTVATITLGGTDDYWLDPTLISVVSGVIDGPSVDASQLGEECRGVIPPQPDVVLAWTEDETVDSLRIFFLSTGDPTMTIVTPDGDILCNDDMNPLIPDPFIEIDNPAEGRYAVFMGSYENDAVEPGFLVFSSLDFTPATLDLGELLPRTVDPDLLGEPMGLDVLNLDAAPSTEAPAEPLSAESAPVTQEMVGGGDLEAFNIEFGNPRCTGFIDATPTYAFDWAGDAEALRIFFEGEKDATLIVRTPADVYECNDDADGANNLNPLLDLDPVDGAYSVWIGGYAPSTAITGTLTIAGATDIQPQALTAEMAGN